VVILPASIKLEHCHLGRCILHCHPPGCKIGVIYASDIWNGFFPVVKMAVKYFFAQGKRLLDDAFNLQHPFRQIFIKLFDPFCFRIHHEIFIIWLIDQGLTCPSPSIIHLYVVRASRAIGPLACSFCVEMPISAPSRIRHRQ